MNLMRGLVIVTVTGSMLWAQAPTKTPSQSAGKVPAQASAKTPAPSTKPTATSVASKPATAPVVKAPMTAAPKPVSVQPKPAAVQTKLGTAQVKPATSQPKPVTAQGTASIKPAAVQIHKTMQVPTTPKSKVVDKPAAAERKAPPPTPKSAQSAAAPTDPVTPAMIKEDASRASAIRGNRRDPFVSPIVRASSGGQGPACETGKRCLMVDQIQLKGIVKSPNGYIAVVENAARRAYFLRENDPVFNGSVVKITGDTVVFREQTVDKLGKQGMREVTKRVNAPAV